MNYTVQIRVSDWVKILSTDFSITIIKITPEIITLNNTVTGLYLSTGDEETLNLVVWYAFEITEPGNFSASLTGDTDTKLMITSMLDFYMSLRISDDQISNNIFFEISEPGLYGVRISFYGQGKGEYNFTITRN